jgi:hypothetical protein
MAKANITITDNDLYLSITNPYAVNGDISIAKASIVQIDKVKQPKPAGLNGVGESYKIAIFVTNRTQPYLIPYDEIVDPSSANIDAFILWLRGIAYSDPKTTGTFVDGDLVGFVLTISLSPSTARPAVVTIKDPDGKSELVSFVDNGDGTVDVDFGASIGAGTFTYIVIHA